MQHRCCTDAAMLERVPGMLLLHQPGSVVQGLFWMGEGRREGKMEWRKGGMVGGVDPEGGVKFGCSH